MRNCKEGRRVVIEFKGMFRAARLLKYCNDGRQAVAELESGKVTVPATKIWVNVDDLFRKSTTVSGCVPGIPVRRVITGTTGPHDAARRPCGSVEGGYVGQVTDGSINACDRG